MAALSRVAALVLIADSAGAATPDDDGPARGSGLQVSMVGAGRLRRVVGHLLGDPSSFCASATTAESRAQIALIGAGWWARDWHLPHLDNNPQCDLVAIVDPSPALREEFGQLYSVPTFASLEQLLGAGLQLDGVLISSPHKTHFSLGMQAINAGLNVLIEKPMTTDPEEAAMIVKAAADGGKIFMVNTTANWREQTKQAVEMVEQGKIGKIHHVQCHMGAPLMMLFDDPSRTTWTAGVGTAGINGFAWGQLSHIMSWVFRVTSLKPCEAFAFMDISERSGADLSDCAAIRCSNGATISLSGTSRVPGTQGVGKQIDVRIFGSDGMITYTGDDAEPSSGNLQLTRSDGSIESAPGGFEFEETAKGGTGPASVNAFIDGCLGRDYWVGADGECGASVVRVLDAMYRSSMSGKAENVG